MLLEKFGLLAVLFYHKYLLSWVQREIKTQPQGVRMQNGKHHITSSGFIGIRL